MLQSYAQFKDELIRSNCQRCTLASGRTQIVVDRGNPSADVLIIGEAPGEKEDLSGKAFVGRAGKLLDRLMLEEGFDTNEQAIIANIVKCRPPKNRRPLPEEAARCLPYLKRQIELIAPRFLILLGATAFRYMIPDKKKFSMKEEAGSFFGHPAYPGIRISVFFHPAYILRDPRKTADMKAHIRAFVDLWSKKWAEVVI